MKHLILIPSAFILSSFLFNVGAQTSQRALESIEAYVSEPAKVTNSVNKQGADIIRKSLKGERFTIPKDWRLVSVVADKANSSRDQDFVLFFQSGNGDVHSFGVSMSGALSGGNMIHIQAK
jgi:hypothetical protein